jgi:PAS domain S-box-containing protein
MDTNLRPSGIEGLGDMAWGTHFCLFYETKEDLLDFFIPFFKAGLDHQEFCLCVASEPLIAAEAEQAMRQDLPDFERYLAEGQIEITPHTNWYLKEEHFDERSVLQGWIDKLDEARTKGFSGVRFAANILLEKSEWESFARYEGKLEETLRDLRIEGLCAYNLNRYSAANVLDIMQHHQFTLVRRNSKWESLEGFQLKQAHEEVLQLNAELEQRVIERTVSLSTINEQLRAEIAEHKRTEEALRESEEKFAAAFRASPMALVIATLDGKFVEMNQAYCDLLGYARQELIGKTGIELGVFTEEARQEWVEAVERDGGMIINRELSFRVRNGISRATLSSVEKITIHGVPHFLSTILDITERKAAEEAIRKSEQVLREAESLGHTGSWEQNLVTGEIFNTEENLRLFFGDDHSKGPLFDDYAQVVHPDDREYVMQRRAQLLTERGPSDIEYRVVWPDGSVHVIFGRATVAYDELGQAIRVYGTNVDITERKRAEEEIRRYAARMAALAEISRTFAEAGLDYQSILNTVARRTAELIGDACVITLFSEDSQRAFPVAFHHRDSNALTLMEEALLHIWQGGTDTERFQMLLAGESIYFPVVDPEEYRAQSEPEFWPYVDAVGVSSVLIVPLKAQGRVTGTLGITRDHQGAPYTHDDQILLQNIADRAALSIQNARLFEQVQSARERLEALSRRLLEVQETERRSLTSELHDRVGQNLTGLSINLQNMKALLSDETAKTLAVKFDDAQALVEDTTRQIRDIMAELYLPELEDYGLAAALETYAERAASRGNLELIADLPDLAPPPLPSDIRIALFRSAQEAISNVLKHADATQLEISLQGEDGRVHLRVEDNGQGFEPEVVSQKEAPSWGLKIMRERIESIGGKVQIESELGKGTRVTFEIERPS